MLFQKNILLLLKYYYSGDTNHCHAPLSVIVGNSVVCLLLRASQRADKSGKT